MRSWLIHDSLHFIVILIVIIFSTAIGSSFDWKIVIAILIGGFFPDIDHLIYYKKRKYSSFKAFFIENIKSTRERKGFLIFHNIFFLILIMFFLPIVYVFSTILGYFLLAFISHLVLDFLDDKFLIHSIKHWIFTKVKELE